MEGLTKWLYDLSWPIVSRVLTCLGLGTITYTGAESAVTNYLSLAKNAFTGLGSEVMNFLAMAGVFDALAITSGGIVSGLAWLVMKHFALQTTGNN